MVKFFLNVKGELHVDGSTLTCYELQCEHQIPVLFQAKAFHIRIKYTAKEKGKYYNINQGDRAWTDCLPIYESHKGEDPNLCDL